MNKYTVTEVTRAVKQLLEGTFKDNISVKGEISSLSRSPAGHIYFVLKDEKAQIKCVMFKGSVMKNRDYSPKNGDSVEAIGEMTVYEAGGNYQLLVKKVDYDSVGLFYQLFEQVKKKLEAEGLFDEDRKRALPYLPKRVAVVTSETGAAIKDFLITMKNLKSSFEVDIWNVPVQGKDAIAPIVKALGSAGQMTGCYDVLVLMRGGGSLEDLALFNEEYVARALAACEVPTISAIGHERDFSICDFAADKRVATPTAAATLLCEGYKNSKTEIDNHVRRMKTLLSHKVFQSMQSLDIVMAKVIAQSPSHKINRDRQRLNFLAKSLPSAMLNDLREKRTHLSELAGILHTFSPDNRVRDFRFRLDDSVRRMRDTIALFGRDKDKKITYLTDRVRDFSPRHRAEKHINNVENLMHRIEGSILRDMADKKSRLLPIIGKLTALDPKKIMSKGYALPVVKGKSVKSVFDISLQDELEIRLKDGYISSFVTGRKVSEEKDG